MDLETGEHLIFEGHPSWRSILTFYLKGLAIVALVGAIGYLASGAGAAALAALLAVVVVLGAGWLKRLFTTYTITNHRLHIRRGILAQARQQTQINRVQNVNTHQSLLQRMLLIGDVNFDTAAGDDFDFEFSGVASPQDVVDAVHRAQRDADPTTTGVQ
jgi:uncharacterized membrane protein YdbT with pleckstrin-like domain